MRDFFLFRHLDVIFFAIHHKGMDVHINYRLRATRVLRGLTQQEFGQKIGRSQTWVSQVENGLIELSDLDIALICRTLGASPNAIFPLVEGQISEGSYAQAEI